MAAGCAVIYTLRSSGPELITDKVNGLLIDPDNADAIANAILLLIQNEALRTTIAKAGRELITEKFNIDNSAREQVAFYNKVVGKFATK
jgi:glycosyltransferase involved in cell wall biosynthesis